MKCITPKHGSWLDIAEIGINIMTRECLDRKVPDIESLWQEPKKWNEAYDKNPSPINWQFTVADSRVKLKKLYSNLRQPGSSVMKVAGQVTGMNCLQPRTAAVQCAVFIEHNLHAVVQSMFGGSCWNTCISQETDSLLKK